MADINVIVLPDGTEYPVSDYYLPVAISNPTNGQVLKYDATNQVWYNGENTSGSSILYGTSAPTSQLGTDGCLYVKYTEGTGGASDTVDALYVKLDGAWCQISTGGGGGASSADQVSVDDTDLEYEADDVQEALEKIYKRMTLAEYEQLSHAEKYNGTIYFITDVKGANQILTKEITDAPIATFDTDRADRLVNLEVAITATGGGGTPVSPIAINGFSACDLVACGVNIWDEEWEVGGYNQTDGQKTTLSQVIRNANYIPVLPNKEFYIVAPTITRLFFYTFDKTFISSTTYNNQTFTTPNKCYYVNYHMQQLDETYHNNVSINYPPTDTQYHAYNGTTETIPFGQTVYGGRLNVGSGVLTITHGYICLYDYNWQYNSGFAVFETGEIHGKYYPSEFICTDYACSMVSSVGAIPNNSGLLRQTAMYIKNTDYTDATQFKNSLTNTYMVYELATPIEIQLDSKQIQAIIGTNNIYADTGDIIDLKFILSVGQAIS